MKRITRYLCALLIFCFGISCFSIKVNAGGEHVYFGSEQYKWNIGQEEPIGIYAGADEGINRVEMEVQYDPAVMGSMVKIQGLLPDRNAEDGNWVSIPLDGSVSEATVLDFLDRSYELVEERLH